MRRRGGGDRHCLFLTYFCLGRESGRWLAFEGFESGIAVEILLVGRQTAERIRTYAGDVRTWSGHRWRHTNDSRYTLLD